MNNIILYNVCAYVGIYKWSSSLISTQSIWRTASILLLFIIHILYQFISSTLLKSKQHLLWPDEIQVNPKFSCITSFFLQPSLYFWYAFTETRPMRCTVAFMVHFFILKNVLQASNSKSHIPTWPLHWFYLKTMLGDEIIIYCFPVWLYLLTYSAGSHPLLVEAIVTTLQSFHSSSTT